MVMLVGQNSGRHKHRHLFAIGCSLESGAHRYLGLAKTDIAAYQAVHWPVALHIGLDGTRGRKLVGRILVYERRLQFLLHIGIGTERKALFVLAGGIKTYKIAGYILEFALGAVLHLLPGAGTEPVDFRRHTLFSAVFGKLVKGMNRHKDDVIVLINKLYHLLHTTADIGPHQSREFSHTVIDVDNIISDLDLLQFAQRQGEASRTGTVALKRVLVEAVEYLMVGESADFHRVIDETFVKRTVDSRKIYFVASVFKNHPQAFELLVVVAEYVYLVAIGSKRCERFADKIEILVIDSLR